MNAVREVTSEGFSYGKDMEICLVPFSILPLHGRKKKTSEQIYLLPWMHTRTVCLLLFVSASPCAKQNSLLFTVNTEYWLGSAILNVQIPF